MRYLERFFQPENWEEDFFTSRHGKKIRYGHAEPAGEKKGTVIMTTGYADFIESYHETIHEYLDRGYAVWIMDWAGQGGSEKKRDDSVKAQTIDDHVEDLRQFRHQVVQGANDGKPVFMSTHSMGGQIGLQYLMKHEKDFDFAVLAAPLVDFSLSGAARTMLQAAFKSAVNLGLGDQSLTGGRKGVTRQILAERKRMRKEDPVRMDLHRTFFMMNQQLRAEDPTFGLIDSLFDATERLNHEKALKNIATHILFGVAGKDDLVDNNATLRAARLIPNAKVAKIDEATHDMWQERQKYRLEWWVHIDAFLTLQHQRLAPKNNAPDAANDGGKDDIRPPASAAAPQKTKGPFTP